MRERAMLQILCLSWGLDTGNVCGRSSKCSREMTKESRLSDYVFLKQA